ncbi:kinase-like domain-containing protein [Aspergillus heterothallicus]
MSPSTFKTSTFDKPWLPFSTTSGIDLPPAPADVNIITFITVVQQMRIPFLPLTWQATLDPLGRGGTSQVSQALVNLETSFAFKRVAEKDRLEKSDRDIFIRLINETFLLRSAAVVGHPHLLELEGLCWDVTVEDSPSQTRSEDSDPCGENKVWPVFVFQKAHYGDLYTFVRSPMGQGLGIYARWKICLDIGAAIAHMQSHYVIHGDVKPENVLIFKGDDGGFIPKVGDFGFSVWNGYDGTNVSVPQSWPWFAPETDEYPKLSYTQGIKTDVFSYGLLCLWFLFELHFSSTPTSAEKRRTEQHTLTSSLKLLDHLKRSGTLVLYATELIITENDLDADTKQILQSFFSKSLTSDPALRAADIHDLLSPTRTSQIQQRIENPSLFERHIVRDDDFQLYQSLDHFYQSDFRIRAYILSQLEACVRRNPTIGVSTQLAICYELGFGCPRVDHKRLGIVYSNDDMQDHLHMAIDFEPTVYAGTVYRALTEMGNHSPIFLVEYYESNGVLDTAESTTRQDIENLQKCLGTDCRTVLAVKDVLVSILAHQHRWVEAEELAVEVRDTRQRLLGGIHQSTLDSMSNLALIYSNRGKWEESKRLHTEVTNISQETLGQTHGNTLTSMGNLAAVYWKQGQYTEAQKIQARILEERRQILGDDHPTTLNSMLNMASIYRSQGLLNDTEDLESKVLKERERTLGQDHPDTLSVMSNLGVTYGIQGRWDKAEMLETTVLARRREVLGTHHSDTLTAVGNLASTYKEQGKWEEAEVLLTELVATRERTLGPEHPDTLGSQQALGKVYCAQGRWEDAEALQDHSLMTFLRTQGPDHPHTLSCMISLATTYWNMGSWISAEILQTSALERYTRLLGPDNPETITAMGNLAATYFVMGRFDEAHPLQVEALEKSSQHLGPEHPDTLSAATNLACTWHAMEQWEEAETLQRRLVRVTRRLLGPEHPETLANIYNLAVTCMRRGQFQEAGELLGEVYDIRLRTLGQGHPFTLETLEDLACVCQLPDDDDDDDGRGDKEENLIMET